MKKIIFLTKTIWLTQNKISHNTVIRHLEGNPLFAYLSMTMTMVTKYDEWQMSYSLKCFFKIVFFNNLKYKWIPTFNLLDSKYSNSAAILFNSQVP